MATEEVTSQISEVNTLMFKMKKGLLALPDIAVAEIVELNTVQKDNNDQASWYLGNMGWRNTLVPLISFDQMAGDDVDLTDYNKVVVVNSVYQRDENLYWGFVIDNAPRMQHINEKTLTSLDEESEELVTIISLQAELMGDTVIFPNLEKIEAEITAQ